MKRVVRCSNCNQITRKYGSFTAELEEEQMVGGVSTGQMVKKVIKLCRKCAKLSGYKVKTKEE